MKRFLVFTVGCCLFFQSRAQLFQEASDSVRRYRSIPAMVYAVFTADSMLDKGAGGHIKMGVRQPISWNSRFNIGINTTQFTAYIAARMVAEKKISWNSTVIEAIPELEGKIKKLYQRVTLLQLLENRIGLPAFLDQSDMRLLHTLPGSGTQQRLALATIILNRQPPSILDSSGFSYSVAGASIAACMLEKRSRKSWEQLVNDYIARPLHVSINYGFPNLKDSSQPIGHWKLYGNLTAEPNNYWAQFWPAIAPAGNIQVSADDYIAFLRDHLNALLGRPSLLGAGVNTLLLDSYAYHGGWTTTKWNGSTLMYGIGRGWVYSSYTEIIPDKNMAILVLCNNGGPDGLAGVVNFGRMLREYYAR